MRLYIVRHGKAVEQPERHPAFPRPAGYPADWDRPLTERGHAQSLHLATALKGVERRLKFILTSRYPRAIQTANTIAEALNSEVRTPVQLEVDHPVSEALRVIEELKDARALMLVGHNPQLGELLSVLTAGLASEQLLLKTGEMVVLDVRPSALVASARVVGRHRLADASAPSVVPDRSVA